MERFICLLIGYAFGLIQTGYIYGKMKGVDIRKEGSGNAGTTNALRTLGKKAGAMTLIGDMLKCVIAILIVLLYFQVIELVGFQGTLRSFHGYCRLKCVIESGCIRFCC